MSGEKKWVFGQSLIFLKNSDFLFVCECDILGLV